MWSRLSALTPREQGRVSYEDYLSIKGFGELFEWVGAVRESRRIVAMNGRSSMMVVGEVTPELTALFQLPLGQRVVVSQQLADEVGETARIDGAEAPLSAVAPEWLDGVYLGRPVDVWVPLAESSLSDSERNGPSVWVLARLRTGVSIDRAATLINVGRRDAGSFRVLPYTGVTPEMAHGLWRIGRLLRAAAVAVFLVAGANVACLLLSRASARAHETAVRVALGASRGRLARQLLADAVVISVTGGMLGLVVAIWTTNIVPLLFFDQDAARLVFAPDVVGAIATSAACVGLTIACALAPLSVIRDDRPAVVLRRESAGPSPALRWLRTGMVVGQMALCCSLVITTGLLVQSLRSASLTNVGRRLGTPIVATVQSRPAVSRNETAVVRPHVPSQGPGRGEVGAGSHALGLGLDASGRLTGVATV